MGLVLDQDFAAGIKRVFHWDATDDSMVIETRQTVTELVEENKARAAMVDERAGWKGDFHWVAQIPVVIAEDLRKRGILDDPVRLKKWLNDRDNLAFRMRPGRI